VGVDTFALAWLTDWSGQMFAPGEGNLGRGNRYWYARDEDGADRFAWERGYPSLQRFMATPGEEGGFYLTDAERDAILRSAGVSALR
jgi:hypothetical protein